MNSEAFQPKTYVAPERMRSLFFDTAIMKKLRAKAVVNGVPENAAIDGDPNTFWLVGDQRGGVRFQPDMLVEFPEPVPMSGLVLMARQNHREHEGDIREYVVQASDDGLEWRDVVHGELLSTFAPQRIQFAKPLTTKYLKLISLSGFGPDKITSLAELAVICVGPKLPDKPGTMESQRNQTATQEIDEGAGPVKPRPPEKTNKPASTRKPRLRYQRWGQ